MCASSTRAFRPPIFVLHTHIQRICDAYAGYGDEYQISWAPYKKDLTRDAGADILSYEEVAAIEGECQRGIF